MCPMRVVLFGLAATLIILVGCSNKLSGELTVSGGEHTFSIHPDACVSGERQGFFGADLYEEYDDGKLVRLIYDAHSDYTVRFNIPGTDESYLISKDTKGCDVFEARVQEQSSEINNVTNVEGIVRLDCNIAGLGKVKADLTFGNCH